MKTVTFSIYTDLDKTPEEILTIFGLVMYKAPMDLNAFQLIEDRKKWENNIRTELESIQTIRPIKPSKNSIITGADARKYADELDQYEIDIKMYRHISKTISKVIHFKYDEFILQLKNLSGLNDIPEKYRAGVWKYAWEHGHSSGPYEVYIIASNMIDSIFDS